MANPRLIAFYLPQFYPTKENDEWWEKDFTEWTNVRRARPLFKGHEQPRIPGELGYYDLRDADIREKQAQLAKEAGIEGFCYWHYWFAGRRLLDKVFKEVVESGRPDFPFCLCWANHSWYKKTWDPTQPDTLLIEQTYPGKQDYINHFNEMLPAFKDPRYMKAGGRLIYGLYEPLHVPCFKEMKDIWNRLAKENGFEGFYFFGIVYNTKDAYKMIDNGFDGMVIDHMYTALFGKSRIRKFLFRVYRKICGSYPLLKYNRYVRTLMSEKFNEIIHPCILPNYDHSPRSGNKGVIMVGHTPALWAKLCKCLFMKLSSRKNNLVFIKAWNEWGEGNYLEPDIKYGKQYIEALRKSIDSL